MQRQLFARSFWPPASVLIKMTSVLIWQWWHANGRQLCLLVSHSISYTNITHTRMHMHVFTHPPVHLDLSTMQGEPSDALRCYAHAISLWRWFERAPDRRAEHVPLRCGLANVRSMHGEGAEGQVRHACMDGWRITCMASCETGAWAQMTGSLGVEWNAQVHVCMQAGSMPPKGRK